MNTDETRQIKNNVPVFLCSYVRNVRCRITLRRTQEHRNTPAEKEQPLPPELAGEWLE
jgi:hypothetical protein